VLYCFGFESVAVVMSDLYFFDAAAPENQRGAERGVRLELRTLEREELLGSVYSAQPIGIRRPIWRVDLLESVDGPAGSFDRTHYHPRLVDWEPQARVFDSELSSDPIEWVRRRLADLEGLLENAGLEAAAAAPDDSASLRAATPEILDALRRLLARVRAGELAIPPDQQPVVTTRIGWL
jgi:hypothetical protein